MDVAAAVRGLPTTIVSGARSAPLDPTSRPAGPGRCRGRVAGVAARFSRERTRWGWRRAATELRRSGRKVNNKRVQRLWREEGLTVPYRKRKKPHRGVGAAVGAMCPIAPNAIWALDFQFDTTVVGRTLKLLNVVDEFTRECLAVVVGRHCDADKVVDTLDAITMTRGAPAFVRGAAMRGQRGDLGSDRGSGRAFGRALGNFESKRLPATPGDSRSRSHAVLRSSSGRRQRGQ